MKGFICVKVVWQNIMMHLWGDCLFSTDFTWKIGLRNSEAEVY